MMVTVNIIMLHIVMMINYSSMVSHAHFYSSADVLSHQCLTLLTDTGTRKLQV